MLSPPPLASNETARLRALHDYAVLDTPREPVFDAITQLAAAICEVPIALISLVDSDRQWFKSRLGLDTPQTARDIAFCAHAIQQTELFEVPDAEHDDRFVSNPLVTDGPRIRFYAGMVITSPSGFALGTVCVLDRQPRRLTPAQRASLEHLSTVVMQLMEGRKTALGEALLAQVLDQAKGQVLLLEPNSLAFLHVNASSLKESQYQLEDLAKLSVQQLVASHDAPQFAECLAQVSAGTASYLPIALQMRRKDGSTYPAEGSLQTCNSGGRSVLVLELSNVSERQLAEQALVRSERRIRDITDRLPVLIAEIDADQRYQFCNAQVECVFGVARDQILGRTMHEVRGEKLYQELRPNIEKALSGIRVTFEGNAQVGDQRYFYESSYIPKFASQGSVSGFYALIQDITERKEAELALAATEARLRSITDNLPVLICYIDSEYRYGFNNATYAAWMQRPLAEITGSLMRDIHDDQLYSALLPSMQRAFAGGRENFELEIPFAGQLRYLRGMFVPDRNATGRVVGIYGLTHDATRLRRTEQQLLKLAQFDSLTGLANRSRLMEQLTQAIARSERSHAPIAVVYLDLDRFKQINDTFGHQTGDQVLQEFARRLEACVRQTDSVARLAGDEFVVVLETVHSAEEAAQVAQKILAAMQPSFVLGSATLSVSTSVGIALRQAGETDTSALLARADHALYQAKAAGRNAFAVAE